jgi:hypothetical protein
MEKRRQRKKKIKRHIFPPDDLADWYPVHLDYDVQTVYDMMSWIEKNSLKDYYVHNTGTASVSFRDESDRLMFVLTWISR